MSRWQQHGGPEGWRTPRSATPSSHSATTVTSPPSIPSGVSLLDGPAPAPGWQTVRLDGPVLHLPAGVRLDLGATAKGLGSDRAVRAAMAANSQAGGVLVSLGGDIAVAGTAAL